MAIGKWSIRWESGLDRGERKITTYAVRHVLIIEIIEGSKKERDGRGIEETKSRKPMERGRVEWEEGNTDSRSSGRAARWMEGKAFFASRSLKWKVTSGGYVVTFTTTIVGIARSVTPLLLAVPGQGQ